MGVTRILGHQLFSRGQSAPPGAEGCDGAEGCADAEGMRPRRAHERGRPAMRDGLGGAGSV